jgi:hypothetical protein
MPDFVAPVHRIAIVGDPDYPYSNAVREEGVRPSSKFFP